MPLQVRRSGARVAFLFLIAGAVGGWQFVRADGPPARLAADEARATRAVRQAVVTPPAHDIDAAGMDRTVPPGDDFFRFANGAWFKAAQIPPDRSSSGIWADLTDEASRNTRGILEAAASGGAAAGSDEKRLGDYYASYMDEAAIESKGLAPVQGFINSLNAIHDRAALTRWICGDLRADVDPLNATNFHTDRLFGIWISQHLNDPGRYAPYILQGGLGMPDREYYLDDSPAMRKIREGYRAHIAAMLKLAQMEDADARAERILALETRIASAHATRTESADVLKANNPWRREAFPQRAPGIDWPACFAAAGLDHAPEFIVWQPGAITGLAALVGSEPVETWRDFLAFHLLDHYGYVLPKAFVDERFAFYGRTLSGTPQIRERWKRAVDATNGALGYAVGQLYVQKFFAPEAKAQLQAVVRNIITAFERRIDKLQWMNPRTRAAAKAKLSTLIVGIGYPDRWRDYSGLEVVPGEALMNAWRAERFEYQYERAKLEQAVDRTEWSMTPQTVNALNLPVQNALNFPAAILRPPFYDPQAPAAVIYGAIGAVIGHEISHSFDDQGAQFDAQGRLRNWWTLEDFAHFQEAGAKLVAQYNEYRPFPDLHVNGQLTLSENIADLAGLSASYDAYRVAAGTRTPPDGGSTGEVSDDQKFFISFAQAWRTKMREPLLRQIIVTDGHAPDEYRADTVRNLDAWYAAFPVKPGQRLFLAPADRVRVW
jgi:predicted metalloendopeptidase